MADLSNNIAKKTTPRLKLTKHNNVKSAWNVVSSKIKEFKTQYYQNVFLKHSVKEISDSSGVTGSRPRQVSFRDFRAHILAWIEKKLIWLIQ